MHVTFLLQDTRQLYGAEQATLDLAMGLFGVGLITVSVTLIRETRLGGSPSTLAKTFHEAGIPCHVISTKRPFSWKLVRAIRRHVQQHRIDCLHAVGYKAAVHGGLAVQFGRVTGWVGTVHGWLNRPNLKERFYSWAEIQALKRAQRVIALSTDYRERLAAAGIPVDRLTWIPSGLDVRRLSVDPTCLPFNSLGHPPTIGILGRLSFEKNHPMFLRVARQLLDQGCCARFLIAGDGPERASIEREIDALSLRDHVEMGGVMQRDAFFRQIDLLLLCSLTENLPYVILEAMAWSRPVVATQVGGVPDLIQNELTGLLVPHDDFAMTRAVSQLLSDPCQARRYGEAGRTRLEASFTLDRSVMAHITMYADLLKANAS